MSAARYAAAQNAAASPREIEIRAFRYVNGLLGAARDAPARATALNKTSQLWQILLTDLATDANVLPDLLKARLISLGLWAQREVASRMFDEGSLQPLIDLHRDMIGGLEGQGMQAGTPPGAHAPAQIVPFRAGAA